MQAQAYRNLHKVRAMFAWAWLLCITACTGDATHVKEESFELRLPGRWDGGYDETSGTWVYLTPSGAEGITIATLRRGPDPVGAKLQADLDALVSMGRSVEQQVNDEAVTLTETKTSRTRGQLTAVFDTIGTSSQRRKRTFLVVNRHVAGSFCYEAFGLTQAQFNARAEAVLRRARLRQ